MEVQVENEVEFASGRSRTIARKPERARAEREGSGADGLSRGLGWFSIGLGLAQLVAPTRVARLAGAEPDGDTIRLMRALGAREFLSGVGILSGQRSDAWIRARVAGDMMDLALLARLMTSESAERGKTVAATLAVAGVTALDLLAARRADSASKRAESASEQPDEPASVQPGTRTIRRAVTINRPPDEVAAFWRQLASNGEGLDEHVRFVAAPGGRGTEVHLLRTYDKPGPIAAVIAKLRHRDPEQLVFDELLALKQIIETGDIVVSDAWLNGPTAPHPAQPE
jgi:uncharacterized membrane protein